jgi:hypothetical protein
MQAQYGDNCLLHSKIYKWIDHFKKGRTSVYGEEIRKAIDIKAWEQFSSYCKNVMGKQTNHSGHVCRGFHVFCPMKEA